VAEHTPGPWTVRVPDFDVAWENYQDDNRDPDSACAEISSQHWWGLAKVYVAVQGDPDEAGLANAHLIASAPDLLAACKLLDEVDCCTGYSLPAADWPKFWAAREAARAAIAKAEGR
jgi:hypothetical protein